MLDSQQLQPSKSTNRITLINRKFQIKIIYIQGKIGQTVLLKSGQSETYKTDQMACLTARSVSARGRSVSISCMERVPGMNHSFAC